MATLNTATSIVDFLKSRGSRTQPGEVAPLFDVRKKLFGQSGLGAEEEFRGTAGQNTALLQKLAQSEKDIGVPMTSENMFSMLTASKAPSVTQPQVQQGTTAALEQQRQAQIPGTPLTPALEPTTTPKEESILGKTAEEAGIKTPPTEEGLAQQALAQVTGKVSFPLQQEAQQAEKEQLQLEAQRKKEETITEFASRGMYGGGKSKLAISAIEADTLAKQLGVDRKFALLIATGLESAAQQIAKEAQAGRKEAIDSLRILGFDVNPITGRIEPTLAAREKVATEARLTASEQRQAEQFKTTETRLQEAEIQRQQQAEENNIISRARLALDIQKEERITANEGQPTFADMRKDKEALANALTYFAGLPNRQTAMKELDTQKFAIATRLGEEGLNKIIQTIDMQFPAPTPALPSAPPLNQAAAGAGRATGKVLGKAGQFVGEPFVETIGKSTAAALDFISGLFGK